MKMKRGSAVARRLAKQTGSDCLNFTKNTSILHVLLAIAYVLPLPLSYRSITTNVYRRRLLHPHTLNDNPQHSAIFVTPSSDTRRSHTKAPGLIIRQYTRPTRHFPSHDVDIFLACYDGGHRNRRDDHSGPRRTQAKERRCAPIAEPLRKELRDVRE